MKEVFFISLDERNPPSIKTKVPIELKLGQNIINAIGNTGEIVHFSWGLAYVDRAIDELHNWCRENWTTSAGASMRIDEAEWHVRIFFHEFKMYHDHIGAYVREKNDNDLEELYKETLKNIRQDIPAYQASIQFRNYMQHYEKLVGYVAKNSERKTLIPLIIKEQIKETGKERWKDYRYYDSFQREINILDLCVEAYDGLCRLLETVVTYIIQQNGIWEDITKLHDVVLELLKNQGIYDGDTPPSDLLSTCHFAIFENDSYEIRMMNWPALFDLANRIQLKEATE